MLTITIVTALLLSGCGDKQITGPVLFHAISKDGQTEIMMLRPVNSKNEIVVVKNPASQVFQEVRLIHTGEFECAIDKAPKAAADGSLKSEPFDSHTVFRFDATDDRKVYVRRPGETGPMLEMTIETAKADPILGPRVRLFLSDCEM